MSKHRYKIKYVEEGPYATTVERTLYVEEFNSTDYIRVYQDNLYGHGGKEIISFPTNDSSLNNFWEKLKSIIDNPYDKNEEVERWSEENYKLIHGKDE